VRVRLLYCLRRLQLQHLGIRVPRVFMPERCSPNLDHEALATPPGIVPVLSERLRSVNLCVPSGCNVLVVLLLVFCVSVCLVRRK
jgi:hypothetical protein